jgi:hypothetical protein
MTLWINLKLKILSIISPLYKKDCATARTIYNTSKAPFLCLSSKEKTDSLDNKV